MLDGQMVGPFLIEKEIGAGAMGAVYRAKYVKTGQLVAIKVMARGSTSAHALARFEREAAILKQLKHPNIVRLFGIGKHHGMPYYAMEFIQGETLDSTIDRRDRMTWEQVIDLGQQLCAALQHAHEAGIVHRDLKPSNLMILADGTVKLTDFGIAKDLDVTQLTATNSTVGTAAYMSPEQCMGQEITPKSDLYSLGVVLYELLTGRKPFQADNAVDMFMQHIKAEPVRAGKLVPDLPPWMDNLVAHLLEKEPGKRPLSAAKVAETLTEIQEKVEAQASAGVEKASARRGDLPKGEKLTEEDKAAARSLLGKKPRKKKKEKEPAGVPAWVQAVGLVLGLAAIAFMIWYATRPPSAEALYEQAEKLIQAGQRDKALADGGPVRRYLSLYGKRDDEMTRKMNEWADEAVAGEFEELIARHLKHARGGGRMPVNARNDDEKRAFAAAEAEWDGNRAEAARLWKLVDPENGRVGVVARRHLELLAASERQDAAMKDLHERDRQPPFKEPELDALAAQGYAAWRVEQLGDREGARRRWEALRDEARTAPGGQYWALHAAWRAKVLKEEPQEKKARVEEVMKRVAAAEEALKTDRLLPARQSMQDAVALLGKDEAMAEAVAKAKDALDRIMKRLR
ncbi:MAG: protein kinase [Gemmataceae bacterium]|nr:protein kinase [Gemmataceae bacterium]